MHPLLAARGRIVLYLLVWVALGGLLGFLLTITGNLSWLEAGEIALPLALFYAFVCLAPWYMCRFLPLGPAQFPRLLGNHLAAASVAALFWIVLARGVAFGLSRFNPTLDNRFRPADPRSVRHRRDAVCAVGGAALRAAFDGILERSGDARAGSAHVGAGSGNKSAEGADQSALSVQQPEFHCALATVDGLRARDMCIKLSDFLRNTLSLGEKQSITLRDELALAQAYLAVEKVRFGSRLRIEMDADAICNDCIVPPLFLQPLVENAVKHGIAGLVDGGTIRLEAHCERGLVAGDCPERIRSGSSGGAASMAWGCRMFATGCGRFTKTKPASTPFLPAAYSS